MLSRSRITISHRYYFNVIQWSNRRFLSQDKSHLSVISNKSFIWKLITGGTLVVGLPYIIYHNSARFHNLTKLNKSILPKEPIFDNSVKFIDNLPDKVPYLIIGGGPSSFSSARSIRSNDPNAKVLIITEENHYPYSRTPLTKELWYSGLEENNLSFKQFSGRERSIYFEHEEFYLPLEDFNRSEHGGISVLKLHKVIKVDPDKQKAYLHNGQIITFEKCIIATGIRPKNLKIFNEASKSIQERVILYRTPEDYHRLCKLLPELNSLTIIGNSFTASELAFSLRERCRKIRSNVKINHVFHQSGVLDEVLPNFLSKWCTERIKDESINVINNTNIENVQFNNNQLLLKLSNGCSLQTDICIVDVGSEPNTELAIASNLETDTINGGIMANSELQVRHNIWAAGNVVSFYDSKNGRRRYCHHDNSIVTGRLAGENASKNSGKTYAHYPRFWSDLGADIGFEAIGQIDNSLDTFSMFAKDDPRDKYNRGVVFYLKNKTIVGIILWNIFDMDNMRIARQVLHDGFYNQNLNEVAKLFSLYPLRLDDNNDDDKT